MSALEIAYLALGVTSAVVVIGGAVWLAIAEARRRTASRSGDVRFRTEGESPRL